MYRRICGLTVVKRVEPKRLLRIGGNAGDVRSRHAAIKGRKQSRLVDI